jgi:hypothetical protein
MRFRKLRIAWSVFCGVACVLLIVLWVRSCWWTDLVFRSDARGVTTLGSNGGALYLNRSTFPGNVGGSLWSGGSGWNFRPIPAGNRSRSSFGWQWSEADKKIKAPCWFLALLFSIFAAVPWIRWHFRLRTLLIATTLVAMVLGLVVYVASK